MGPGRTAFNCKLAGSGFASDLNVRFVPPIEKLFDVLICASFCSLAAIWVSYSVRDFIWCRISAEGPFSPHRASACSYRQKGCTEGWRWLLEVPARTLL